uniref:BTB domain-containing protein n=1 Tax=Heterorhabditis bacteriophora TaxID=37862 RepID=A0A1I7XRN0_HETBA
MFIQPDIRSLVGVRCYLPHLAFCSLLSTHFTTRSIYLTLQLFNVDTCFSIAQILLHAFDAITVETVRDACKRTFIQSRVATTVVGRTKQWPSNEEIEKKLHR